MLIVLWTFSNQERETKPGVSGKAILSDWLNSDVTASFPEAEILKVPTIKNPEIPKLSCYRSDPDDSFWKIFPSKGLPKKAETMINIEMFEKKVTEAKAT